MRTILLAAAAAAASAAIAGDKVTTLPGWSGDMLSNMYSGYLSIPGGKHLHYVFVESQNNPSTDPVVLWFNGGPGCSSLEGMFAELGPYWILPGTTTLIRNPYSWNNFTNSLFLESPAGVGFSYADTPDGLVHNDSSTAADALAAIQGFFAGFPEYQPNDFYISGESYAGIYVPTSAYATIQANAATSGPKINLKGIMVGNGCLGTEVGVCGSDPLGPLYSLQEWVGHGLVSGKIYENIINNCDWQNPSAQCDYWYEQATKAVGHINTYFIYGPCHTNFSSPHAQHLTHLAPRASHQELQAAAASIRAGRVLDKPLAHYNKRPLNAWEQRKGYKTPSPLGGPDACIDAGDLTAYLNQPGLAAAFHVTADIPWVVCSGNISYTPTEPDERQVIYPAILNSGARVLIYNGEADACVPYTDNEAWTVSMNITQTKAWAPWMVNPDWVGGYVTQYARNFTFTTIRGAGHMVPEFQPAAAWSMANIFINAKPWPIQQ